MGTSAAEYAEAALGLIRYYPGVRPIDESGRDARAPLAQVYATLALAASIIEAADKITAAIEALQPGPHGP